MRVMWTGNINNIDIFILKHIIDLIIYFTYTIFFCKIYRLLMSTVSNCIQGFSHFLQRLRHFICNHTCSKYRPVKVFSHLFCLLKFLCLSATYFLTDSLFFLCFFCKNLINLYGFGIIFPAIHLEV